MANQTDSDLKFNLVKVVWNHVEIMLKSCSIELPIEKQSISVHKTVYVLYTCILQQLNFKIKGVTAASYHCFFFQTNKTIWYIEICMQTIHKMHLSLLLDFTSLSMLFTGFKQNHKVCSFAVVCSL